MKTKLLQTLLAIGLTSLIMPGVIWAAITGTAHDFSASAWNDTGEICVTCHTPHNAQATQLIPLWNHTPTATAAFTLYASSTLQATVAQPDGASMACLSCHDGTIALDQFGGNGVSPGTLIGAISANADLGTGLENDHPISFDYNTALATSDGGLRDPSIATVGSIAGTPTIQASLLIADRMQCSSCHDVHASKGDAATAARLLIVDNGGSDLCLTCHDK
jgi:predicted CXXCH cytochrome family protein